MIAEACLDDFEAEIAIKRTARDGLPDSTSQQEKTHGSST
jgi:hypothetical protein